MAKNMSRKRSTRRKRGGANAAPVAPATPAAPVAPAVPVAPAAPAVKGGKRKTRKVSKGASDWNKKVMEVYRELKKKNPLTKLGDAMKECSKRKKRGDL
jgi:hypothetical protein